MTSIRPGDQTQTAAELENQWKTHARWSGVARDYSAEDVIALRGSVGEDHTLARGYSQRHMSAYVELQEAEFASEADSSTLALVGSTESEQFH